MLDLGEISSRIMRAISSRLMQVLSKLKMDGDLHMLDVVLRHDEMQGLPNFLYRYLTQQSGMSTMSSV
ncbi:MAG: hypothetical protein EZS28_048338 [Streblomastix strix]|uniref:Uncharacterized protein n=1 Tax=Streblomastix strix TaxID=222440 RepID=A0A5J4TCI1_9EUKA|nr:MAG: hypothetical protein EZS28_048338 [Streblomastix strix]